MLLASGSSLLTAVGGHKLYVGGATSVEVGGATFNYTHTPNTKSFISYHRLNFLDFLRAGVLLGYNAVP